MKIFVADDVKESGLEPLKNAGFEVEKKTGLKGGDLLAAVADCAGMIVRSETKVTAEVMDAAKNLRVIGRAGVGVDNIDVKAATQRGIVVMNAPDGNTITTGEHTMALLVALARKVPPACASLKEGRWEKKKFVGVELFGKTLGIVGLGRIGRVVATRAKGFGMKIVAYDPFLAPEQAGELGIESASLDEVFARADFLTVHTPMTPETRGIVGAEAFAKMKRGVRVINCARGGLVDEDALLKALDAGLVAGAALDVFSTEPPPADHPLLHRDDVIVTPHLGASTTEAQEGVAVTVAEQMRDYLSSGELRGAVNAPSLGASELEALQPYINLANSLGRFLAQTVEGGVREVKIEYARELTKLDAAPVTRALLAGLLQAVSSRVNVVNALHIAEERGINITIASTQKTGPDTADIAAQVMGEARGRSVAGSLFGPGGEGRITEINGFRIEAVPHGNMIITRNRDVPGVIGRIGGVLGERGVNISRFHLGRDAQGGEAMAVIETDGPVDQATLNQLQAFAPVLSARQIEL
jgi:D-3-phosphoglycerate dehydrogenase